MWYPYWRTSVGVPAMVINSFVQWTAIKSPDPHSFLWFCVFVANKMWWDSDTIDPRLTLWINGQALNFRNGNNQNSAPKGSLGDRSERTQPPAEGACERSPGNSDGWKRSRGGESGIGSTFCRGIVGNIVVRLSLQFPNRRKIKPVSYFSAIWNPVIPMQFIGCLYHAGTLVTSTISSLPPHSFSGVGLSSVVLQVGWGYPSASYSLQFMFIASGFIWAFACLPQVMLLTSCFINLIIYRQDVVSRLEM